MATHVHAIRVLYQEEREEQTQLLVVARLSSRCGREPSSESSKGCVTPQSGTQPSFEMASVVLGSPSDVKVFTHFPAVILVGPEAPR